MAASETVRKHKEYLFPAVSMYYKEPIALVRGEGAWVWDDQGNKYLDAFGGVLTVSIGHANPKVVEAIVNHDPRIAKVYFDISGVAGLGHWEDKVDRIAARVRQLGVHRVLYGSDGAGGGNATPKEAWSAFRRLPLTAEEFRTIENNVAPYMK